jgi:hypothetical protein
MPLPLNHPDEDVEGLQYHSDSFIPEMNLSLMSSFRHATATPQNNTGITGISSQPPPMITQPTIMDEMDNGACMKNEGGNWLKCFSPPIDATFFTADDKGDHSLYEKSVDAFLNEYHCQPYK